MLKIGGLELLRHLQGSLEITGLANIVDVNEVFQADLKMKENLQRLTLQFDDRNIIPFPVQDQDRYTKKMETVLRGLEPHAGLKGLVISHYPGREFPFWISSLSKLISLELNVFNRCVNLPSLGKLPLLKVLSLAWSISLERLEMDFYGVDRKCDGTDIFPRLEELHLKDMPNLIEWEFPHLNNRRLMPRLSVLNIISCPKLNKLPFQTHEDLFPDLNESYIDDLRVKDCPNMKQLPFQAREYVFPYLQKLRIEGCSSQLLVGVGRLKSLTELGIGKFEGLQGMYVDRELSEISLESKLQVLKLENIDTWEEWSLPFGNDIDVFNNVSEVHIRSCKSLRALPGLGRLKNLVTLEISDLPMVTNVGLEFLGMSYPNDSRSTSFPNLKNLEFSDMPAWEKWEVPFQNKDTEFFPKLQKLEIKKCNKLLALPALGKLNSLESLTLEALDSLEHLGTEFLGIWSDDNTVEDARSITVFPKLKHLDITEMANWEGEEVGPIKVMPCLEHLVLKYCSKLVVVPSYMFSDSLTSLYMTECPNLIEEQPYLPSQLEELSLSGDLGKFSESLPVKCNSYHQLTDVSLSDWKCKVLPEGFYQLTAIKNLSISRCKSLRFTPQDFTHLNNLETLEIYWCSRLTKSCRRGESWSTTSRPPTIIIFDKETDLVYGQNIEDSDEETETDSDENPTDEMLCQTSALL